MDPELQELMEKNLEISEENNILLKKIWGSIQIGRLFKTIYWIFIIGATLGAYYYVQPYLVKLIEIYSSLGDPQLLQKLLIS